MDEENVTRVMEMISAAGLARAKYLEAVRAAKKSDFEMARVLMEEGDECFGRAHELHSDFLASGCGDLLDCKGGELNLILVHGEDQMMCAETFRVLGMEMVELYKVCVSGRQSQAT
ncbi:MAG: PTS lactose/cellobiose transporter subunit IIA [Hungatella sp.]|nr:PTS lactose/cellobiose transporter subunit IIA [Hungatella sp.]